MKQVEKSFLTFVRLLGDEMMVIKRQVTEIEADGGGYITLRFACGHITQLLPTGNETAEHKAERFEDAQGELYPCEKCTRLAVMVKL